MIRAASEADARALAALWNPVIRDTVITFTSVEKTVDDVLALIRQRQAQGAGFLVAEDAAGVQGFATYGAFRAGPGYAKSQEHTVILAPTARRRGVGRGLMSALEDHARRAGHRCLIGAVSGSNPGATAFHLALGYAQVGRVPDAGWKFGQFHDLVLMHKML